MKPWHLTAILACLTLWNVGSAHAGMIALPPPGPARVAKADAVIVGKVESIEPQDIKVGIATYRIAVVRINDGVRGVKTEKTLRVGFIPLVQPKKDGKGPFIIRTGARPVQLAVGQEGLFILRKQDKQTFYTIGGVVGYYINSDKNKDFDKEVQAAKVAAKAVENPQAALKSKDAEERLVGATILIEKYRTFRPKALQEAIDAGESKLILQALANADWQTQGNYLSLRTNPIRVFQRLGVSAKDGFRVGPGGNYQAAAQAWLRDNAGKYRIQRYVVAETK